MTDQVDRDFNASAAQSVAPSLSIQFQEVIWRVWARRWLIVSAFGIMAALVLFANLPGSVGLAALLGFIASTALIRRSVGSDLPFLAEVRAQERRTSRELRALIEALPDPAILLNASGQVLSFNARASGVFAGLRGGAHIASLIRTPDFLDALAAAPRRGHPVTVSYAERVPVGRRMAVTVAPLTGEMPQESGRHHLLVLLRDLTEGERINQMRADFIANASHELRTPLASLRGFIETLQGKAKEDPEARDRFLKIMGQQAQRMTRLIDELLSLSRVEMNVHVLPSTKVDLDDILSHVCDSAEPLARDAGMTLEVAGFAKPAIVRGDRDELVQVFQNLIQNALKYAASGKVVRVEATRTPETGRHPAQFRIAVIDRGPGIAVQHLPRLTERFYRVDVASSREKGGTGLGLAIVKHILARHRGELLITSDLGKGSRFTVVLPEADRP